MSGTIIALSNQKGGVTKTTTCANLGIGLAMEGKKVLLVDTDPQGSLTISLGYPQPDQLPVTITDLMKKVILDKPIAEDEGILHQKEGVEYIVEHPYEHFIADIDSVNLGIVITQLCSNGARLTHKGCVRTYYTYKDGTLAISVESHGKGISPEQLEHIFDHFGSAMETQTGLSLPICKSLMELMGGTVDIQSDYGHQTTITVTLPCHPVNLTTP